MHSAIGQSHRWGLLLVCLIVFYLRGQGINWPEFHPDESSVGAMVEKTARGVSLKGAPYANGFFVLVKPAIWISRALDGIRNYGAFQRGLQDQLSATADYILIARWFNVWAGMLVCLIGYLLLKRITRSPWAGVFGAALLGLAQYPVEHSHYGETDIAMLLTLTTALWLMAVAADTKAKRHLVLAALAGGFAAGTKFQLVLLLPVLLALVLALPTWPRAVKTVLATAAGRLAVALIFFLLGFLIAMPQALDLDWFLNGLAREKARVYAEAAWTLGPLRGNAWVRYFLHFRELREYLPTIGWPWLVLVACGLLCLAMRDYRRFWSITLFFPALYLVYFVFLAPWVRSQEFIAFLPSFAVLAALPLIVFWRSARFVPRLITLLLALAALAVNGINGSRSASLFGWTDTRLLARQWLQEHLPEQAVVATENYAEGAWPDSEQKPVCIYKIEKDGLASLAKHSADYLLRSASVRGRGLRNPVTGELLTGAQKLFYEFQEKSEPLRAWAPLPAQRGTSPLQGLATFVSPALELYGLAKRRALKQRIDLELPQPLFVSNYYDDKGRQTFFTIGHKLGAATGLLIDRRRRVIAVGGPVEPTAGVYLVLNTAERAATVIIRGFGQTRRVELAPYDVTIVPLKRPAWLPRLKQFEEITLSTEPVRDVLYIPCFARLVFTPAEAARICLNLDRAETILRTFFEAELESNYDPATLYLLAVRSGRWKFAEQLQAAAQRLEGKLALAARSEPAAVAINGNSGYYFDQFARVRLNATQTVIDQREEDTFRLRARKIETLDVLDLTEPLPAAEGQPPLYRAVLQLSARLARGTYVFSSEVMARMDGATNLAPGTVFEFYGGEPEQLLGRYVPEAPGRWTSCAFEMPVLREAQPRLVVRTQSPARLYFRNTEFRWTLASQLEAVRDDLIVARAVQAVAGGKFGEARAALATLAPRALRWNELELRQLDLAIARGLGNQEAVWQAARRVLDLAPGDYASLQALAETDAALRQAADGLTANLKVPVEFGNCLSLVGFTFDSNGGRVNCVWEAQKNETPPMAATFWIRRRGEWRKKQVCPLSARPALQKGERVAVDVVLSEKFAGYTPEAIALGLETAVEWQPSALPVSVGHEGVVPFSMLLAP